MNTNRKAVALSDARAQLGELVNEVRFGDVRVVLTSHGKIVGAIINAADLEELEDLDAEDLAVIAERTSEPAAPFRAKRKSGAVAPVDLAKTLRVHERLGEMQQAIGARTLKMAAKKPAGKKKAAASTGKTVGRR